MNSNEKLRQKKQNTINTSTSEPSDRIKIAPFFITRNRVRIKKGETVTFVVQFLPFELSTQSCKLVFFDSYAGEF